MEIMVDRAHLTYPEAVAVDGREGFTGSFHDRLTLLSPINNGDFECNCCKSKKKYIQKP